MYWNEKKSSKGRTQVKKKNVVRQTYTLTMHMYKWVLTVFSFIKRVISINECKCNKITIKIWW
jgi:hypothetical protein